MEFLKSYNDYINEVASLRQGNTIFKSYDFDKFAMNFYNDIAKDSSNKKLKNKKREVLDKTPKNNKKPGPRATEK